jgi:hypothetical protein
MAFIGMLLDEVRKEEELQDDENDKKLYQDDGPQRLAQPHVAEAIVVEVEDTVQEAFLVHPLWSFYR